MISLLQTKLNIIKSYFVGTALNTQAISDCWEAGSDNPYCTFARDNFNYAVAENSMKWRAFEPEYDQYDVSAIDNMMDWMAFNNWGFR